MSEKTTDLLLRFMKSIFFYDFLNLYIVYKEIVGDFYLGLLDSMSKPSTNYVTAINYHLVSTDIMISTLIDYQLYSLF